MVNTFSFVLWLHLFWSYTATHAPKEHHTHPLLRLASVAPKLHKCLSAYILLQFHLKRWSFESAFLHCVFFWPFRRKASSTAKTHEYFHKRVVAQEVFSFPIIMSPREQHMWNNCLLCSLLKQTDDMRKCAKRGGICKKRWSIFKTRAPAR